MDNNKMSKIEIATYLKKYFELLLVSMKEPNKKLFDQLILNPKQII